jgi:hypothetical protein
MALWHRWFDSREHRRAREVAEANYSHALVRVGTLRRRAAVLTGELAQMTRERDALAEVADGHIGLLHEDLTNARRSYADALDTISGLRRELEARAAVPNPKTDLRVADQHAEVSKLPATLTRDRANANALAAENADLRAEVERLQIALKEGNPS